MTQTRPPAGGHWRKVVPLWKRCVLAQRWRREGAAHLTPQPVPQVQQERDELYRKFTAAILEVQQKVGFKNLLLERKLQALNAAVEKKEVQFNEVLASSNLDPAALSLVSRKLEVGPIGSWAGAALVPYAPAPSRQPGLWSGVTCLEAGPGHVQPPFQWRLPSVDLGQGLWWISHGQAPGSRCAVPPSLSSVCSRLSGLPDPLLFFSAPSSP